MKEFNYSFIIPHKNCPDLLQRCVDSIPERDDVQVIVVDDNSDDDKKPALTERKGLEIVLLDASHSKGAGHARNVGLEKAEGKWLLFPDADDYYKEGFLEVLDQYKDTDDLDVVYFSSDYVDGSTGEPLQKLSVMRRIDQSSYTEEDVDIIRHYNYPPWDKMVSLKLVRENELYYEESINGNDVLFSLFVGALSKSIKIINDSLYIYLRNPKGLTSSDNIEAQLCRINHVVKTNSYYRSIKHNEWKFPLLKTIVLKVRQLSIVGGTKLLLVLCARSKNIYQNRNEWVAIIAKKISDETKRK